MKFAAMGIDHRHIFGMAANLMAEGAEFAGWWTEGSPEPLDGFVKRFPGVPRVAEAQALLDDPEVALICISCIPRDRAAWAIRAMEAGKDVMTDKPGCTKLAQLSEIRAVQAKTGRIWSIDFSERFEVPSVTKAAELVAAGAIGRVVQTVGLGPHRLNRATRPDWFFDRDAYGGILTDIASHQIDQFLFFTGSTSAEITLATAANLAHPGDPGLQDFGEIALRSDRGHGYIRVDWFTPDALPTWGDGRLTILGTEGYIELRKYVDVGGRPGTDHLILVNGTRCEMIDASGAGMPYFGRLMADIRDRTETAMPQAHAFTVMDLALRAQAMAEGKIGAVRMIGVAIIGAGIGREHLAGYRALPHRFAVLWLIDLDTARAGDVAGDDLAIAIGADIEQALADPAVDLIDVCLPPHLHVAMALRALQAGKHVVLEKPIAPSLAECDLLEAAERASGRRLFPVFQYRYGPGTAALDALIAAGLVGKPQVAALETHWNRGASYYAVPWRGTWAGERGGAVLGHAIHNHDLLCRYFGAPAAVSAQLATRVNLIETEDCAAIALRFDTGALATSSITLGAAGDTTRLRLVFEHLTVTSGDLPYAPADGAWVFTARDPAGQAQVDAVLAALPVPKSGFAGYFDAISDAIYGVPGREVTLAHGRRSIELVTAVYAAARSGKEVALPLLPDAELYRSWLPEKTPVTGAGAGTG